MHDIHVYKQHVPYVFLFSFFGAGLVYSLRTPLFAPLWQTVHFLVSLLGRSLLFFASSTFAEYEPEVGHSNPHARSSISLPLPAKSSQATRSGVCVPSQPGALGVSLHDHATRIAADRDVSTSPSVRRITTNHEKKNETQTTKHTHVPACLTKLASRPRVLWGSVAQQTMRTGAGPRKDTMRLSIYLHQIELLVGLAQSGLARASDPANADFLRVLLLLLLYFGFSFFFFCVLSCSLSSCRNQSINPGLRRRINLYV